MKKHSLLLIGMAMVTLSSVNNTFGLERRITDGPHIGFVTGGDTQSEEFAWGWQGAYDFYRWLTLEASYTRHEGEFPQEQIRRLGLPPGAGVDLGVNNIALSARWHVSHGDYHSFYLGAGGNFYLFNEDGTPGNRAIASSGADSIFSDFSTEVHAGIGYHAAVGVEISLHEHWELFAEYRLNVVEADVDHKLVRRASSGALLTTEINDTLSYDHNAVRLGVNYRF